MRRSWKSLGGMALVASAALLPLYGDARPSPVSHPEWARMILRALDLLEPGAGVAEQASQVFSTLSGKGSRSFRADLYAKGAGVDVFTGDDGARRVRASEPVGSVTYPLAVARGGDYRMRLRLAGAGETEAEVLPLGKETPIQTFRVVPAAAPAWVDAGSTHLDPGAYSAAVLMPRGSVLEFVEFAPPCVRPIEPRGGWQPTAVATTDEVALTALQAVDLESELPPAAMPIEWRGTDMRVEESSPILMTAAAGLEEGTFRAGTRGGKAVLVADLPEAGFYTLSVYGLTAGGESWLLDACRKSVLCPVQDESPRWRVVLSGDFASGPHSFAVTLGPGSTVGRLRLERKKDAAADYVATVRRLGLDLGTPGPITREKATEARKFIAGRRALDPAASCGDVVLPGGTLVASIQSVPLDGTGSPALPPGTGQGNPVNPPVVPPQEIASPVLP